MFQLLGMICPSLKNAFFDILNIKIFPEGPRSSIDSNSRCSCCETRVDLAIHTTPIQLPSRIQGATRPASTLSFELAAVVVSVGRTGPARRLCSLLFVEN